MKSGTHYSKARAAIALIASYAFALQMLLASAVVTQHAAFAATNPDLVQILCLGAADNAGGHDPAKPAVQPATCIVCAAATASLAMAPDIGLPLPSLGFSEVAAQGFVALPVLAQSPSPKLSQGPPDTV